MRMIVGMLLQSATAATLSKDIRLPL